MNTSNTIDRIAAAHYVATEAQVEALAHDAYGASVQLQRADGTYMRILIAGSQAQLGAPAPKRRKSAGDIDAQMSVLDAVHTKFYAAVLRGVTTPEVAADANLDASERQKRSLERNRRSTFARSAKATLAAYVRAGGDLRAVVVGDATKASLRAFVRPAARPSLTATLQRTHSAFIKAVTQCCTDNPERGKAEIERAMAELRHILAGLNGAEEAEAEPQVARRHARTVAGQPVMR